MKNRPTYKDFKKKALMDEEIKEGYEKLKPLYDIKLQLIKMRKDANLTQEEVANIMHTKRSNISRLESFDYEAAPKITTLIAYAEATGHQLKVEFK
ncbi:MAG: helix-turn-helix transcriptional regulator [Campylobacterota bacterium]|nr:helix-turn-helix transcriptional regulator [Campylobacterota bacterium]